MKGTPQGRRGRGPVAGFLVPAALLVWAALHLTGVMDAPDRGSIGALLVVAAVIGAVLHVLRLRRVHLERGEQ